MMLLAVLLLVLGAASLGNGADPLFQSYLNFAQIEEILQIGDFVGTILATDADNDTILYSIRDNLPDTEIRTGERDGYDYLQVDPTSGNVTIIELLDYEVFQKIRVQFVANDGTKNVFSDQALIYIINNNDNYPMFTNPIPYVAEVTETTPVGTTVYTANATDLDGDGIVYMQLDGPGCETKAFSVDSTSGEVRVNMTLDYAEVVQYVVCIRAQDTGEPPLTSTQDLNLAISIRDVQNLPPVFQGQPYDESVKEDSPVGSSLIQVFAIDGDRGVNPRNTIEFSLNDTVNGTFSIDMGGNIRNLKPLDRDTDPVTQLYTLIVQAREDDDTQPESQITSVANVYLRLIDVDDNAPRFEPEGEVSATIQENSPRGTQVQFNLIAYDFDSVEAGKIKLSLIGANDIFELAVDTIFNSGTVDVRVGNNTALDYETTTSFSFQIKAESSANSGNFSLVDATVNLTNINDNTPAFTQQQYDVLLPEDSMEGTFVIQLQATDDDADTTLIYNIAGLNDDWYNINSGNGNITVSDKAEFDAELLSVYFLTCQVSDGERVSTALLNITVTDVNDTPPKFQSATYSTTISEYNTTYIGDVIIQVTATDGDVSPANNQLEYSITSGNDDMKFGIDNSTGEIYRADGIDVETEGTQYTFVVMATDSGVYPGPLNDSCTVKITITDVNDNDPLFTASVYNATVNEDGVSGFTVTTVKATDDDIDENGVIYAIEGASMFVIDASGRISLSGALDYEVKSFYNLTVTATDRDSPFGVAECRVEISVRDVNDEPPVFFSNLTRDISILENATISSTVVHLLADDPDTTSSLKYSITNVDAFDENNRAVEGNFTSPFDVDDDTGIVRVSECLDREVVQRYDVTLQVRDSNATVDTSQQVDTADLVITVEDVNDNAPKFIDLPANFTIAETNQEGLVISVNIRAEDPDADDNGRVAYELMDDAEGKVAIDEVTGVLSVASPIDRESNASLSITVRAKDLGNPVKYTDVTRVIYILDVNDNTPEFNESFPMTAEVLENSNLSTIVMRVLAVDLDADPEFATIKYSISAGNGNEKFSIDQANGEITVTGDIDRETESLYTLTVVASDGTRQDNLEVTITILDVNDERPEFTEGFPTIVPISEATNDGTVIATISAVDMDKPGTNNSLVRYKLTNDTDSIDHAFAVDSVSGAVEIVTDNLVQGSFLLCFVAYDLGSPPMTSEPKCFEVVVTDFNDNNPVFVRPRQGDEIYLPENYTGFVTTVQATDEDDGINANITYQFDVATGSVDYSQFTLDEVTGDINIVTVTDREELETYILTVQAINKYAEPSRSSEVTFSVVVNDTNDNLPLYWGENTEYPEPREPTVLTVLEEKEAGTTVGYAPEAEDKDGELFNKIYYFIVDGNEDGYFVLDQETGRISLARPIDRETIAEFSLVIKADSDPNYEPQGDIINATINQQLARVMITVTDINDNGPVFSEDVYYSGVLYSTLWGDVIIRVTAEDADEGSNAITRYSIDEQCSYDTAGIPDCDVQPFSISDDEGDIIAALSFSGAEGSRANYYTVKITATDSDESLPNATSIVNLYYLTEYDQLNIVFRDEPDNIIVIQDDFMALMKEIVESDDIYNYTNVAVSIDDVDYLTDGKGEPIDFQGASSRKRRNTPVYRTLMKLHVINNFHNTVIPPDIIQYIVDHADSQHTKQLEDYKVQEISYTVTVPTPDPLTAAMTSSFILAGAMLLLLLIVLLIYFCRTSSLKRQVRALMIDYRLQTDQPDTAAPNTNHFAEQPNPLFNNPQYQTGIENTATESDEAEEATEPKESEKVSEAEKAPLEAQEATVEFDKEDEHDDNVYEYKPNQLLSQLLAGVENGGEAGVDNPAADFGKTELYFSDV